jgi:hypothetical protein
MPRGTFVAVGVGIGGVGQTTLEAVELMRRADRLFHCLVEPTTELWLRELNPSAATLNHLYEEGQDRALTYDAMVETFVSSVRAGYSTCAAYYGHPGVFVEATHRAIRRLRRAGYAARMVPGVSADGCLYADLLVNPGEHGMQSCEASAFLYARRRFSPTSGLILWQVGVLGETGWSATPRRHPERLAELRDYLLRTYPAHHGVVLYFGSTFPCDPPRVSRFPLAQLASRRIYPMDMLYVPPLPRTRPGR